MLLPNRFRVHGYSAVLLVLVFFVDARPAGAVWEEVETEWGGPAETAYDMGFVENVRRHADGGIGLFDMDLIENDAPGSGMSARGAVSNTVWGSHQAKKVLHVDDPRAHRAYVVLFTYSENPPYPLTFTVNDAFTGQITMDNRETYRWAEFPVSALKQGDNAIVLTCPQARSEEEGWEIYLADAAEFEEGGGDPSDVGESSFKSTDGGATWQQSPFGESGDRRAEYSVRLGLDRYRPKGMLATPVIDLWRGDSEALIVPLRNLQELRMNASADLPKGTRIRYFMRRGVNPSPHADGWEPYTEIGQGAALHAVYDGPDINRRYVQVKATLETENPLVSPVLHEMRVSATLRNTVDPLENIVLRSCENPQIRYPSVAWEWESANRPEFAALRAQENLDALLEGCRGQFQQQLRLLDHATKRWVDGNPTPDYPGWDATSILDRINMAGAGGMCIQSNNTLAGMCLAYGWQARHLNISSHEVCEVWSDEFGKWVYLDAHRANMYIYSKETGEPLSVLELHDRFLNRYYPDRSIDWMHDTPMVPPPVEADGSVGKGFAGPARETGHDGVNLAAFVRLIPRTNWFEKPVPRPVAHGMTWWPWDGYVNWYDARTPPKRQYSRHTDRKQDMWPDLNRVRVHASSGAGDDRLPLHFETYTPNFSHFEVNVDNGGWEEVPGRWMWLLESGQNALQVRAVNQQDVRGKPTEIVLNRHTSD